jgi:hypothetical protein
VRCEAERHRDSELSAIAAGILSYRRALWCKSRMAWASATAATQN